MQWSGREVYDSRGCADCRVEEAALGDRTATELVTWAAKGDQAAWDALVERYTGLVWSVARAHNLTQADAADAVQTSWLRLVENLDDLRQPERVGAWLASTARHECLRMSRRSARERPAEFASDRDDGQRARQEAAPSAETASLDRAGRELVLQALAELGERCRTLLRMLASSPQPSYADVADALDIPVGSIGPTRARCLDRLRRILAERDPTRGRHDGD